MNKRNQLLIGSMAAALLITSADAQTRLTRNQIVEGLYSGEAVVAEFDPVALQREADRRAAMGGGNAPEMLADELSKLRQFNIQINFDLNSARILPESYYTVGLIADALHTPYLQDYRFLVVGHTDATGGRELNLDLSKKRAAAVRDALVTTFHVPNSKLTAIGLGEEQLLDPAQPDAAVNRRVQLINLGQ